MHLYIPAAMVSPLRRMSTLPISLFTEKGSRGMGCALAAGPDIVVLRRVICTSADTPFVSTLDVVVSFETFIQGSCRRHTEVRS